MSNTTLSVQKRDTAIRAKKIRENFRLPGVVYGHHTEPMAIEFDYQEFRKAYRVTGAGTLLYVELDGKEIPTLVHDVQYDPVFDTFRHIDFLAVNADEKVKTHIPVVLEGLSPAVKNLSGILMHPLTSLEIKCLPKHLIHDVKVNVSGITHFHQPIHVKDLPIFSDENIDVLSDGEAVVAVVNAPRGYVEEVVAETTEEVAA